MFRHRPIIEEEPLPDADFLALRKSLEALRPIREYRLRTAEREFFKEKKKLEAIDSEIDAFEQRLILQQQTEIEQRRTLAEKNKGRNLNLEDLNNWAREEKKLMSSTSNMAVEREQTYQQKHEQQKKIEQSNLLLLSRNLESERLKIMLEEITQDNAL